VKNSYLTQPRYVVPLIILPFLFLFYFIFRGWGGSPQQAVTDSDTLVKGQINPQMPGVAREVTDQPVKDKFGAYQEVYRGNTDFSMMGNIDAEDRYADGSGLGSAYSSVELDRLQNQKTLDSLDRVLRSGQQDLDRQMRTLERMRISPVSSSSSSSSSYRPSSSYPSSYSSSSSSSGRPPEYDRSMEEGFLSEIDRVNRPSSFPGSSQLGGNASNRSDPYQDQMQLFREQMRLVDSMQQTAVQRSGLQRIDGVAQTKGKGNNPLKTTNALDPSMDSSFRPLPVGLHPEGMTRDEGKAFHTLKPPQTHAMLPAMIDQELKVHAGNRVRIRLLQDIYVGSSRVPKGTYVYAQVTGFQTSRINLSVRSVMLNGQALPVELEVYDRDGYLGLYVPGSNFREFSKEIGTQATRGLSQVRTADQTDLASSLISQLFTTATGATTRMIGREKAVLTYNYSVYLKEKQ
jgi:conjugative transposon TraM protein